MTEYQLLLKSVQYRRKTLTAIKHANAGHTGGSLSCTDILNVLYNVVLKVSPENFEDPDRDRYIQSKGHSVEALYVVLADKGFFPEEDLKTLCRYKTHYPGHPTRSARGIEQNTGALGHGLSFSVGVALAGKQDARPYRVFTLVGDGELSEGSNWEASLIAAKYRLDNLIVIVDRNGLQITGKTEEICPLEPLKEKLEMFGYSVRWVDGNNVGGLVQVFGQVPFERGKPSLILARTTKGKGVSFIENALAWHHHVPNDQEFALAMQELESAERRLREKFGPSLPSAPQES